MKTSLILLPGLGGDAEAWKHQIDHLKDISAPHVIVFDKQISREEMADEVLKRAPSHFALAGHSLGRWVAQAVAAKASQRITKLILINTWTLPDSEFNHVQRESIEKIQSGQFEEALDMHLPKIIHPSRLKDKKLTDTIRKIQRRASPEMYCRQIQAMINDYSTLDLLPKISCETLVIHGREDALFSLKGQETLARNILKAKLAIIEECGHASIMEQPVAVTALMRLFLSYY